MFRSIGILMLAAWGALAAATPSGGFQPAAQRFEQEVAAKFTAGLPAGAPQLLELNPAGEPRVFAGGQWYRLGAERWEPIPELKSTFPGEFVVADTEGAPLHVAVPWADVRQMVRQGTNLWVATVADAWWVASGRTRSLQWPGNHRLRQIAVGPDGTLWVASSGGLFAGGSSGWTQHTASDGLGRAWAVQDVLGVAWDAQGRLWFACAAGVGCQTGEVWKFYTGREGLPWNEFTGLAAGPGGTMWFGTRRGAIRFDGSEWAYRQGLRWLPHDDVRQMAIDARGNAWALTAGGVGVVRRQAMTLAEKASLYETELTKYVMRPPYGYLSEASLKGPGDKASATTQDSDNDGLWTAMYGAGECFAVGATGDPAARARARQAFEALRFLQKVTQGGDHAAPLGFVARTVRPVEWPDPNANTPQDDIATRKHDSLWKIYAPRWPKSADGKWYWKSDTSSDELDGHYFFYPLYYDLCADTPAEKERVREVVRDLTDHLISHDFTLTDHDGTPTRWGMFGPRGLNHDPMWSSERGLNSLSMLTYLAVAAHVTGDSKYNAASRVLIDQHGYAHNAMYAKVQHGPGSGNQSDDEMAFMCYYSLLRYSTDEPLKALIRYSFYRYWANEFPEMNPFFNFAYAAHNIGQTTTNPFGTFSLTPWKGWHEDSLATLYGFPLDRLNWSHQNRHRLDLQFLTPHGSSDIYEPRQGDRGQRINGKVLPVENRHFNHWNTDPWALDYGGSGNELGSGTVFLLPYYMGLYHGFIAKP